MGKLIYDKRNQNSGYVWGYVMTGMKHKRGFWGPGNVLFLDHRGSYTGIIHFVKIIELLHVYGFLASAGMLYFNKNVSLKYFSFL